MDDATDQKERLLKAAEKLTRFRFRLPGLAFDLERFEPDRADEITDIEAGLRASLESALAEHFDPLLRSLLEALEDERARLLETVLDLTALQGRLQTLADSLPRPRQEEAMIEGEIPPDSATEIRTIVSTVNDDQLDLAIDNLLYAAGYRPPEAAGCS